MAVETLVQANKFSNTTLQSGVIDLLTKDSPVLSRLTFETLLGNSLTYNQVTTRSDANFYAVGDTWTENTFDVTQATAVLKIMGGDADIDNFIAKTRSNINDVKALALADKTLAVREKFMDSFYYGLASSNPKSFDGLHALISSTTYNTVSAGAGTGTALSINKLRQAIDLFRAPFTPQLIVMSRAMRRGLSTYLDSVGAAFVGGRDEFGMFVKEFDGIPVAVDDNIVDTETAASGIYTAKTGGANTSIFILNFGPQAVAGLQAGPLEVVDLGNLETKDAMRYRIKWYTGLKFENLRSSAKVDGIIAASAVTA